MKTLILLFSLLSASSYALEFEFIGPCSKKPLLKQTVLLKEAISVGAMTIKVLDHNGIAYQGNEVGINQILNSPIGLDSMEIISDQELLAYGWCFEIDGVIPEVYPNQIQLRAGIKVIRWFYGYAHYLNGEWVGQCQKSYLRRSLPVCKN